MPEGLARHAALQVVGITSQAATDTPIRRYAQRQQQRQGGGRSAGHALGDHEIVGSRGQVAAERFACLKELVGARYSVSLGD